MRTVVLDTVARDAVDSACKKWVAAERAWDAIEWCMARDPLVGVPLVESGKVRGFQYDGARSIHQPDVSVIYEMTDDEIIVRSAVFTDAKAQRAGHG